ncbi:HK97-gp10 family putative phage morphogenesis protein [Enterococcus sp. UD-01]|jgi:HK97 gp10 family phage protein|uniref:HK97-gp10 family putative phage morphogenesis protein n=1 Tax=Enterococcus sp. UD-01 TaxID=3373911 RepID=UPI003835519D
MGKGSFKINGLAGLSKKLKKNASMDDVKTIVKTNTAELTAEMQRESQIVLTGHWEGKKFVKPTGATKRSITMHMSNNGLAGHAGPKTEYAPYLIRGTRYMVKRDFFLPPLRKQKQKFRSDLERLMQ